MFDWSNRWIVQYTKIINNIHNVAYGTKCGIFLNSCPYNTLSLSQFFFHLILQMGGTYAIMGRESHDSTFLHKLTASHIAHGTHMTTSILSLIKFYKISIKVRIFFRLLPFSALLLMANQGGNQTFKASFMLQKTAHVVYGIKTTQNQNHGHFP